MNSSATALSVQASALDRIRSARSGDRQMLAERIEAVWSKYLGTGRDKQLAARFDNLLDTAVLASQGLGTSGKGLAVIGESGAGKTEALKHLFASHPELAPFQAENGTMRPLVSFVAPSPCTLKQLGREALHAMGYELETDLKEHLVWERVRRQIKERQVLVLHIDEMQHAVRTVESKQSELLSDTLKNIMQQSDWPVSLVVSGLPSVAQFLEFGEQLRGRFEIFPLTALKFPDHMELLRWLVNQIAGKHAGLKIVGLEDEFCNRLCHATTGQFGRIIKLTRFSCDQALRSGSEEINIGHFAAAYRTSSGCDAHSNVFLSEEWHSINPSRALEDLYHLKTDAEMPRAKKARR